MQSKTAPHVPRHKCDSCKSISIALNGPEFRHINQFIRHIRPMRTSLRISQAPSSVLKPTHHPLLLVIRPPFRVASYISRHLLTFLLPPRAKRQSSLTVSSRHQLPGAAPCAVVMYRRLTKAPGPTYGLYIIAATPVFTSKLFTR